MTTTTAQHDPPPLAMITPYPSPGALVQLAYADLDKALHGDAEERKKIGPTSLLPRPWEPGTCRDPELRDQVWHWLEEVVIWLNREYTWDTHGLIPYCWPAHPHLVHEIAVIADQRRRAGLALTSEPLEEWHRYCLPPFIDRMRNRVRAHCDDGHKPWPGTPLHNEHLGDERTRQRETRFARDLDTLVVSNNGTTSSSHEAEVPPRRLEPVDPEKSYVDRTTGELHPYDNKGGHR